MDMSIPGLTNCLTRRSEQDNYSTWAKFSSRAIKSGRDAGVCHSLWPEKPLLPAFQMSGQGQTTHFPFVSHGTYRRGRKGGKIMQMPRHLL